MTHHTPRLIARRLTGLAATAGILAFMAGVPVALFAVGAGPNFNTNWVSLRDMLTGPDDGTFAIKILAVVAWLAWAVMTISLLTETISALRGTHAPRLPGLGFPQFAAAQVVAVASLLFIAFPVIAQTITAPQAHAAQFPHALASAAPPAAATPESAPTAPPVTDTASTSSESPESHRTVAYTVKRGDSLWKIAREQLDDPKRYDEIIDLNPDTLGDKPDFITAGTVLRLPHKAVPEPSHDANDEPTSYSVKPGDTLTEIALAELGDATRYTEIVEASRDTVQPDGARLRDPNLIRPGWVLTIPDKLAPEHTETGRPTLEPTPPEDPDSSERKDPPVEPSPTPVHTTGPIEEPSPRQTTDTDATNRAAADDHANEPDQVTAGWLLPGLAGTGAALAGALLIVIRRHHRTQLRFRRPGQIIVPPPPALRAVEKTAHAAGTDMASRLVNLDALLRCLVASVSEPPPVVSVELRPGAVVLHLAHDTDLPSPWEGTGTTWSAALDTPLPEQTHQLPPYPLLVTIGSDNDVLWLLNLEHTGVITVTGNLDKAEAFGRYIAAELALNPWSVLVCVDAVGIGPELAKCDSSRLRHHDSHDLTFLDQLARDLDPDTGLPHADPDLFHAVITVKGVREVSPVHTIAKLITSHPGRPGAAVVALGATPASDDVIVDVTTDGRLVIDSLGLDLNAVGLSRDEAAVCAEIVDITHDADTAPMPVDDTATERWREVTDCAGALREDLIEARPESPEDPGGEESLLPLAAGEYADAAATTFEDIKTLAPLGSPEARHDVEAADPTLDDDLALWFDPNCPLPKLVLLGPVSARAHGDVSGVAKRKPFYTELLAYLALHPSGATSSEIADAMSITTKRAYVDLNMLRSWLGTNPRTGTDHLPSAKRTRAAIERGTPAYQLDDVLVDLDLFRRLRARAQAHGSEGITDLETALRLVAGSPFTQLRPVGWTWLLDGERLDHVMTCAVVDVAHILTTHALTVGDPTLARFSAETACHAAPYDEISRLDLVQVAAVTGHSELAERQLIDDVFNRSDDDLGPIDLPPRTAQVVAQRGWDQRKSHE